MRQYYEKYKKNGLCVNCGTPTAGTTLCETCREKRREADRRYRIEKQKTEVCSRCLKNQRTLGRSRCQECSILHKQESAKRYNEVIKGDPIRFEKESRKWKNRYLQRKFGITLEEYDKVLGAQNGVCRICYEKNYGNMSLAVDHNHVSGVIRGLLCNRCNTVIGLLRESPILLHSAESYLKESLWRR